MHEAIHYTVDGKTQSTMEHEMTPVQIIERAGGNPDVSFLVEVEGDRRESFHDRPHHHIHMHNGQAFETSNRTVHFKVDDEVVSSTDHMLTPVQIMRLAGVDPAIHYLVRISEHHQESYKDKPDTPIPVTQNEKFITLAMGPTPVSER